VSKNYNILHEGYYMLEKIINYIIYLKRQHNLDITIHDANFFLQPHMNKLIDYNIHSNPYCLCVKSEKTMWDKCIHRQYKIYEKCKDGPFYGMCYAGVCEYVVPILAEDKIIGFVSVSGYRSDDEAALSRVKKISKELCLSKNVFIDIYQKHLKKKEFDLDFIICVIEPMCAMIANFYLSQRTLYENLNMADYDAKYIYSHALVYIRLNYSEKITLHDISRACYCSESYLSRVFKKHSGMNMNAYINMVRVDAAKKLLCNTSLKINEIASRCGFSDSNYFTNVFTKATGSSPITFRKAQQTAD